MPQDSPLRGWGLERSRAAWVPWVKELARDTSLHPRGSCLVVLGVVVYPYDIIVVSIFFSSFCKNGVFPEAGLNPRRGAGCTSCIFWLH